MSDLRALCELLAREAAAGSRVLYVDPVMFANFAKWSCSRVGPDGTIELETTGGRITLAVDP